MSSTSFWLRSGAVLAIALGWFAVLGAQHRPAETDARVDALLRDGMFGEAVAGAPFSATATLTWQPPGGGPPHRAMTRYFRDTAGRVRVEQAFTDRRRQAPMRRTFLSPQPDSREVVLIVDDRAMAIPRELAGRFVGGWNRLVLPLAAGCRAVAPLPQAWHAFAYGASDVTEEPLGQRTLEGLSIVGQRFATRMPSGAFDAAAGLEMRGERWMAPDLRVLVYARVDDAQLGRAEYQLAHISRAAPAAALFAPPAAVTPWPSADVPPDASFAMSATGLASAADDSCRGVR
jgi:hypothetical protein